MRHLLLFLGALAFSCAAPRPVESITGPPVLKLKFEPVESPAVVGDHVVYGVSVTNVGDSPDTDLRVKLAFDETFETISGKGATPAREATNSVVFEPLDVLRPGETAEWRVVVRALEAGVHRVQVGVRSDNAADREDGHTRFRDYQE